MNLTETILVLAVAIVVIAGVAVVFTDAREKNSQQKTMQALLFMRSNIEQIFSNGDYSGIGNDILVTGKLVPAELLEGNNIRTNWGSVTVEEDDGGAGYAITLDSLNSSACQALATLSTTSWGRVEAGGTTLYDREVNDPINNVDLINACSATTNSVTFVGP